MKRDIKIHVVTDRSLFRSRQVLRLLARAYHYCIVTERFPFVSILRKSDWLEISKNSLNCLVHVTLYYDKSRNFRDFVSEICHPQRVRQYNPTLNLSFVVYSLS